jgi:16S rRNA (cytosine1402-N4)-methyltransferase
MNENYHIPVLLQESLEGLNIKPDGIYVDLTFGGGGHSAEILKRLSPQGRLVVFDTDYDALVNIPEDERVIAIKSNFKYFINFLRYNDLLPVDGILADLGVSSFQFDNAEKGFTYREDTRLDMRMNKDADLSAFEVINEYSLNELKRIFNEYGEIYRPAYAIASAIVEYRKHKQIETTGELVKVVDKAVNGRATPKFLSQLFQAIRIEVNDELESLKEMLLKTPYALTSGGRLVIITYHSLEDKIVKYFLKYNNFRKPDALKSSSETYFRLVNKKVITPDKEELKVNKRSRSAKLRIAERL